MDVLHVPRTRLERLIGIGRTVLAVFSLLAIWLDPSEPANHVAATYALLAGYVAYAIVVLAAVVAIDGFSDRAALPTHAIDLSAFTVIIYLTEGATSPFFVFFIFFLLAAALRWQWRGVLWTALVALTLYVGVGVYVQEVLRDPAFELNRFIIRIVYLAVAAVLLGYLSAYEQQLRKELVDLAAWPRHVAPGALIEAALRHAAGIFGTERLMMLWEETEEPWRYRAELAPGAFDCVREPVSSAEPLVAEALQAHDFLCLNPGSPQPTSLYAGADGIERWQGAPLAAGLQARLARTSLLAVRIAGDGFEGRLFVLDRPGATTDDLALGGIVARQISADLQQFYVQERLQQAVVSEERVRFARELHDGVLQTLTGLALQLKAVQHLLHRNPEAAHRRLGDIENVITAEQADLRIFVQQMKPLAISSSDVNAVLISHLQALCERAARQWDLRVELTVEPPARQLSEALAHAAFRIVQEALANAARHGAATHAHVQMAVQGERLRLTVADNGRGLAFCGRYDLADLDARGEGPASLKGRIASLEGELVIESGPSGARLEIALPLKPNLRLVSVAEQQSAASGDEVAQVG